MAAKRKFVLPMQMVAGVVAVIILVVVAIFSSSGNTAKFAEAAKLQGPPATCGNLICDSGETQQNCGIDCLPIVSEEKSGS